MKSTIVTALLALSFHVTGAEATPTGVDHSTAIVSPAETNESKLSAVPEAGAVVLGLVGAMLLLRRRRS